MKSKFLRILALILVMSSLLSMFTIFASAAGTSAAAKSGEAENGSFELMYNRTFDDDLDDLAGMSSATGGTEFKVEENAGNKFLSMNLGVTAADGHDYVEITGASRGEVGSVIEFDVMVESNVSVNNPVSIHTIDGATEIDVLKIQDNKVSFLGGEYADVFTMTPGTWYTIQVILDYENAADANTFNLIIKHGEAGSNMQELTNEPISTQAAGGNGVSLIRLQATGEDAGNSASVCFDNIKYYEGANEIVNITADMGNGTILGGAGGGSGAAGTVSDLTASLSMKVGVNYSYVNSARTPIFESEGTVYGAPVKVNGQVMIPLLAVVDYIGDSAEVNGNSVVITGTSVVNLTVGSTVANVANKDVTLEVAPVWQTAGEDLKYVVVSLSDINKLFPKYYTDYDATGYIVVSTSADLLDREQNMNAMVSIMKKFVFDSVDGDSIYNDVKEYTNFQHPYLLANGDDFARIREEYNTLKAAAEAGEIEDYSEDFWKLRNYYSIISAGQAAYEIYAAKDAQGTYDTYAGVKAFNNISSKYSLQQSNSSTLGYDASGRSDIANRTALLKDMTYAYVLTEDTKYLELSYEVAIYLGDWNHWGPGYFVNCADAASDFAIFYDWTYQGYIKLAQEKHRIDGGEYNVATLAHILANQGVHEGYLAINEECEHESEKAPSMNGSKAYSYLGRKDYWSSVSVDGMTLASLAILDGNANAFADEAKQVLGTSLSALMNNGLDLYAPDGSYEAGPSYWNYGTNSFFNICAALDSATGGNYGLMDCWGIDTTCYYAIYTEDNNSNYFAYHESTVGSYDASYFFYVAEYFGDATLSKYRYTQINTGLKNASILDMIYYPASSDMGAAGDLSLDYYAESADLFAARSDWDKDALFVSMIGGKNNSTYGQMDAGDFVYHNGGIAWITDLGTENSGCKGLWDDATRYKYYVMKPEGNNTVTITSDTKTPYGQNLSGEAQAYKWGSNEYGSYVAYDMGKSLGTSVYKWERGVLVTNDRKTTVIQDQVDLANNMHTVYWFAHYNVDIVNGGVTISADGKTAYMKHYLGTNEHGQKLYQTLRLSIVTPSVSPFKFQVMSTYSFVNSNTYSASDVAALGGSTENSRDKYMKLAICGENVNKFEVAVVIELVDDATIGTKSEIEVGYSFMKMSDAEWLPVADTRGLNVDNGNTVERRGTPNIKDHLYDSVMTIKQLADKGTLYTDKVEVYYKALSDAYYAVRLIGRDMPETIVDPADPTKTINIKTDLLSVYNAYKKEFTVYRDAVVNLQKTQRNFAISFLGIG